MEWDSHFDDQTLRALNYSIVVLVAVAGAVADVVEDGVPDIVVHVVAGVVIGAVVAEVAVAEESVDDDYCHDHFPNISSLRRYDCHLVPHSVALVHLFHCQMQIHSVCYCIHSNIHCSLHYTD